MCITLSLLMVPSVFEIVYAQEFIMREGKRVSNVLYILRNKFSGSNETSDLAYVTKPRSQTFDFPPDYRISRGVFMIFMIDSTRMLVLYHAYSLDITHPLACT